MAYERIDVVEGPGVRLVAPAGYPGGREFA